MRPMIRQPAITGSTTARTCEHVGGDVEAAPVPPRVRDRRRRPRCTAARRVPSSRGTAVTSASSMNAIIGTVTSTHAVITARAHGFSDPVLGRVPPVRQQPEQRRPDPVVEVGDAGQVGEHVVAVEAQQRQQLLDHLQDLGRDQQQQRVPPRGAPPGEGEHHDDGVEVQAAEVGADPARPAQPVAVGHVGVERRPHQVEPGPHDSGLGSAVARGGGVPELVEAPGEHRHHEHEQQQVRPLEGVVRRRRRGRARRRPTR